MQRALSLLCIYCEEYWSRQVLESVRPPNTEPIREQVNYVAFLQESDPPPAVLAALGHTHAFLAEVAQKDGLCPTEALGALLGLEGVHGKMCLSVSTSFLVFTMSLAFHGGSTLSASSNILVETWYNKAYNGVRT